MENSSIFRAIFEAFPDGIVILDHNDEIIFVNGKAEEIRNISRAEKIGKSVLTCHPERSQEKVLRALKFLKEKENTFHRMVIDHKRDKIFENSYQAIFGEFRKVIGTVVISKDITDKYKLQQENLKQNKNLQEQISLLTEKLNSLFLSSLTSLVNTLEAKDPYTKGHSIRVTDISRTFIEQSMGQVDILLDTELAGKLHDIGKIGIRESILNKPGRLTDEEYEHMKMHPLITEQILSPFPNLDQVVIIAKHHHERFDGKGYPDGLKGEDIPLGSRILALADTYDAMTSSRPYRKALDAGIAIEEIKKNLGTQFDPQLGKSFLELVESGTI